MQTIYKAQSGKLAFSRNIPHGCVFCHALRAPGEAFLVCSGCKAVRYCVSAAGSYSLPPLTIHVEPRAPGRTLASSQSILQRSSFNPSVPGEWWRRWSASTSRTTAFVRRFYRFAPLQLIAVYGICNPCRKLFFWFPKANGIIFSVILPGKRWKSVNGVQTDLCAVCRQPSTWYTYGGQLCSVSTALRWKRQGRSRKARLSGSACLHLSVSLMYPYSDIN